MRRERELKIIVLLGFRKPAEVGKSVKRVHPRLQREG